jgi:asparagine synthase (glutamine-hydrolysing)
MCGITGVWHLDNSQINEDDLQYFNNSQSHRGPDSSGIYIDNLNNVGLGHRRLAIQDLSVNGAQPMILNDRFIMSYNGEVYNFIEIREELKELGFSFNGLSDTEVILSAFECWGVQCFKKFNGMWAIAIWDKIKKEFIVCVDRFGVKPVHYYIDDKTFSFASEVKAFASLERIDLSVNNDYIKRKILSLDNPLEHTFLKKVFRVKPGHYITFNLDKGISTVRWWNTSEIIPQIDLNFEHAKSELERLLDDSLRLRMRSNVKFGIPVSGGIDSSTILSIISRILVKDGNSSASIDSFVVMKHGIADETSFAVKSAELANAKLHKVGSAEKLTKDMLKELVSINDDIAFCSEGPHLLYKNMRKNGCVVSIDGHGADELISGYPNYIISAMKDSIRNLNLFRLFDLCIIARNIWSLSEVAKPWQGWHIPKLMLMKALKNKKEMPCPANNKFGVYVDTCERDPSFDDDLKSLPNYFDETNKFLYYDVHFGFLPNLLRFFDHASMAHGVEARTPFLDWRIVSLLFSLKSNLKIGRGFTKLILREIMKGKMHKEVLNRKAKMGFISFSDYYKNSEVKEWIISTIESDATNVSDNWDKSMVSNFVNDWKNNVPTSHDDFAMLLFMAQSIELVTLFKKRRNACVNRMRNHSRLAG